MPEFVRELISPPAECPLSAMQLFNEATAFLIFCDNFSITIFVIYFSNIYHTSTPNWKIQHWCTDAYIYIYIYCYARITSRGNLKRFLYPVNIFETLVCGGTRFLQTQWRLGRPVSINATQFRLIRR